MEDECLYDMGNFHNDTQLLLRKKLQQKKLETLESPADRNQ